MARDYERGRGRARQDWTEWYRAGAAARAGQAARALAREPDPVRWARAVAGANLAQLVWDLARETGMNRAAAAQVVARAARQLAVDSLGDWGTSAQESGSPAAQGEFSGLDARGALDPACEELPD